MPSQTLAEIKANERLFITGKTGSGKTFFARHLTQSLRRLVVLDGKGTLANWRLDPWDKRTVRALEQGDNIRLRVLPPLDVDPAEFFDNVIMHCYEIGDLTIYIDELYSVVPPNQNAGNGLWAAYTRGREYGLGVWASTQRPVWVPLVALSESEHFVMFRLSLRQDRNRMAAFMGEEVENKVIKDKHGFYYMAAEDDGPTYVTQLQV